MNNSQARTALRHIPLVLYLERYLMESAGWSEAYKTEQIAAIKVYATAAGIDLSAWTGEN